MHHINVVLLSCCHVRDTRQIEVRYGSKRYNVTVDRNDMFQGVERLKTFVSRKKALLSITPDSQGGRDASGGTDGGAGSGGASSSGSVTAASFSPTVRPDRIRLIHGGGTLVSGNWLLHVWPVAAI